MALHLGIELGPDRTHAAVDRDGALAVVRLGPDVSVPTVAHVGPDAAVAVGDLAVERAAADPAGLVRELVAGPVGGSRTVHDIEVETATLLGRFLADVVDLVAARNQRRPDSVTVVHPDGWTAEDVQAVVAAARAAGVPEPAVVAAADAAAALAERRVAAGAPEHTAAVGAAVAAAARAGLAPEPGAPRIVTREDLEGPAPPPPARPRPVVPILGGSRSVFDPEPDAPAPAVPPTTALPVPAPPVRAGGGSPPGGGGGGPGSGGGGGGGRGGGGPEPGGDGARWIWGAVAAVAAVVAVLVVVLLVRGDGDDVTTTTSTTVSVPATTSSTTSLPTTTTTTPTTTVAPTTTVPPTTTAPVTTTTQPPATTEPPAGPVGLADFGLVLRPGSPTSEDLLFGEDADVAVTLLRGLLGSPTSDSGWTEDERCDGDAVRLVRWGALEVALVQEGEDDEDRTREFRQWFLDNTDDEPEDVATLEGIGIGDRLEAIDDAYGDAVEVSVGDGGRGYVEVDGPADGLLELVTSGISPLDVVLRLWSGAACERPL